VARDQSDQRDKIIAELRQQSARRLAEINGLKAAKDRLENDLRTGDLAKQDLAQQRSEPAIRKGKCLHRVPADRLRKGI